MKPQKRDIPQGGQQRTGPAQALAGTVPSERRQDAALDAARAGGVKLKAGNRTSMRGQVTSGLQLAVNKPAMATIDAGRAGGRNSQHGQGRVGQVGNGSQNPALRNHNIQMQTSSSNANHHGGGYAASQNMISGGLVSSSLEMHLGVAAERQIVQGSRFSRDPTKESAGYNVNNQQNNKRTAQSKGHTGPNGDTASRTNHGNIHANFVDNLIIPTRAKSRGFRLALPDQTKKVGSRVSGIHWQQASLKIEGARQSLVEQAGAISGFQAHRFIGQGPSLVPNKSESELSGAQWSRNKHHAGAETGPNPGQKSQGFPRLKEQLKQPIESNKPFQFLSSLGNKDAETVGLINQGGNHGLLKRESALGLAPRQHGQPEETQTKTKSQVRIFTQLDVSKPISSPSKGKEAPFSSGFVVELVVPPLDLQGQMSSREQRDFKINTHHLAKAKRTASAAGASSRLSRRAGAERTNQRNQLAKGSKSSPKRLESSPRKGQGDPSDVGLPDQSPSLEYEAGPDGDELNSALIQSFGQKIMTTRPTTAFLKETDDKLPYPELFDRSERTFAATFAKFGDLSYFTPVQRIGVYMDYSQRLKKRHLTDLIAYLKTAKHPIKAMDEDQARTEAGLREFLENCLFHGAMPLEDASEDPLLIEGAKKPAKVAREALSRVYDFPPPLLEDQGQFSYNQVWSGQLMKQVELSTRRFLKYIDSPDSIRNEEVAKFRKEWMQKALDLIPDALLQRYSDEVKRVFQEVFSSYVRAMKQAILEYILRSPDERKRLHILMLPQARLASSLRHAKTGGYSISRYPGLHQRKLEAEAQLKLGLITSNIVTSSLQSWWADFQHFDLVEMRNLGQFIVERDPGQPGSAVYAMEMNQFFEFQESYRRKVVSLLRHIWHRGCMLVVKKFKFLRTVDEQRIAKEGNKGLAAQGKWTFCGYKPGQRETSERRWVDDAVWRAIYQFDCDQEKTPLQAYYMRAAAVHSNVHLHYFLNEKGLECTDVPAMADLNEEAALRDLADIRDCTAYRAFQGLIGGQLELKENGYEALSKEQRRELKFAAGNLMQYQLREIVDRSVKTLRNFFKGFLTLEQLKEAAGGSPLRLIRPLVTSESTPQLASKLRQARGTRAEQADDAARRKNPALAAQLAKRQEEEARQLEETNPLAGCDTVREERPELKIPDFMDFQDFVSPVFRLDLQLHRDDVGLDEEGRQTQGSRLEFSHDDEDILAGFSKLIDAQVTAFDDFSRPEFCKLFELSPEKYEVHSNELAKNRRLATATQEKARFGGRHTDASGSEAAKSAAIPQDFETLLYPDLECGPDVYRKYIGRLLAEESDRAVKGYRKELIRDPSTQVNSSSGAPKYVDRFLRVADQAENCYKRAKQDILHIVSIHLREVKRVLEVYQQFEEVIRGALARRVARILMQAQDDGMLGRSTDKDYAALIKELRYLQKLSRQLPTIIFLPMFEVGVKSVKEEIQRRLDVLLNQVFETYEAGVITTAHALCNRYESICEHLGWPLSSPSEVVQMDRYKSDLLLDMTRLQAEMQASRDAVFFLLRADRTLGEETQDLVLQLHAWPRKLDDQLAACEERHEAERSALEAQIAKLRADFERDTGKLEAQLKEVATWGDPQGYWINIDKVQNYQKQLLVEEERMTDILAQEKMIFGCAGRLVGFSELRAWFAPYHGLWIAVHQVMTKKRLWAECALTTIDPAEVDELVRGWNQVTKRLQRELTDAGPAARVLNSLNQEVTDLTLQLPTIEVLCSPSLRPRHWVVVQKIINSAIGHDDMTLVQLKRLEVHHCLEQLAEISEGAKREARLEIMLTKMQQEWESQELELTTFRDTGISILQGPNVEEIQARLDEHCLLAQTIRTSPDVVPILDRAEAWMKQLNHVQEVLEVWVRVQANFLYLEPVLRAEDIRTTLPREAREFEHAAEAWRSITARVKPGIPVVVLVTSFNLLELLTEADQGLERILKGLNAYLEMKRERFPRFYFLSNEELLEILGESKKPERVQIHLKKCFEGIDRVIFEPRAQGLAITGLVSKEGELVELLREVTPAEFQNNVEQWLLELEAQMELSVQDLIHRCIVEYARTRTDLELRKRWLLAWQGQAILVSSQQAWTERVEAALSSPSSARALSNCSKESEQNLAQIVSLVREALPGLTRMTLGSLIVLDVHAKDALEELIDNGTQSIEAFDWVSRLRYYFEAAAKQLRVRMVTAEIAYGHEYLGNTSRLVITPLTDRCYRTLMTALELNLGGAPEGPAGTGKTETTKDLAKVVAVHCLVFNCAEGLDALSMAKFFKGLASAGSWSCFDEFNRIDVEVLSVVAQQILEIQSAKGQRLERFLFEESWITLKSRCNIFITMNPGYAGRAELPDNLKVLFRPVAMMIPDYTMIGEITLYSYGFLKSRVLAEKIVATFRLCSEQLSVQHHYDYGMRAVKAVLEAARQLKQRFPQESEAILILRSITNVNLPKFVALDIPLFEGIVSDLFPGSDLRPTDYGSLEASIREETKAQRLQDTEPFVAKVLQLYEMVNCRHGLMLVGPPLAAKTSTYRVLAAALSNLAERRDARGEQLVETHVLNPKSLALAELYGSFDSISHEFSDGLLGRIFRDCAGGERAAGRQWIVFDGPVDAEWVENMNTVLDDNRKLCLLNGEVIQMCDGMSLLFETDDLSQASPATVSRCGMVYLEPAMLGVRSHLDSWLAALAPRLAGPDGDDVNPIYLRRIIDLFEGLFTDCADFVLIKCTTFVPCSEVQLARSLMGILETQLVGPDFLALCHDPRARSGDVVLRLDMHFLYSLVWSVGAVTDELGQRAFSEHLRKATQGLHHLQDKRLLKLDRSCQIPDGGQIVHEYYVDGQRWVSWRDKLLRPAGPRDPHAPSAQEGHQVIVPTSESLKVARMLRLCLANRLPLLLVGPTGTGKSVSVQQFLRAAPREVRTSISIIFSAKTTTSQTSEILLTKLEKRGRRLLGPAPGKRCTVFVDDLSMPSLEQYGAQPPVELLRQLVDHRAWYDQLEKGRPLKEVIDLDFIAAMGPAGGGRNPVTPRLLRHFNIVSINNFSQAVLLRIFGSLMDDHLRQSGLAGTAAGVALKGAVEGSVDVLLFAQRELRPTPNKSHYLFNLRDLARVVQGLQTLGKAELGPDAKKAMRLWVHEVARVFSDRLTTEEDQRALFSRLSSAAREKMREDLASSLRPDFQDDEEGQSVMARGILFTNLLPGGRGAPDEVLPSAREAQQQHLTKLLEDYNGAVKKPLPIVLFDYAVVHLLRICRVLKMPQGHAFLIGLGGTGRSSLSRLATSLCDHSLVELEASRGYSEEQWRDDLRAALLKAGRDGSSCVLILPDAQIKGGFMLDDINNLLNSGGVPNLFPIDERMQIQERVRVAAKRAGRHELHSSGTQEELEDYFIERTRAHLHIVLAMSPVGNALRDRIRNFPSLVNCCTIDWFMRWPDEALEAVCDKILVDADLFPEQRRQVARACRVLHRRAIDMSALMERQRRHIYVTPTSYLELLRTYKMLLGMEREKTLRLRAGYQRGVQKLLATAEEVQKMRQDLNEKQPRLEQMTVETDLLVLQIEKESTEVVEPKQAQIQEEEAVANQMAKEAQTIKVECDNDLGQALPILAKAQEALNTIKSQHINEIKVLGKPPEPVKRVLHAVCVMCQRKADRMPKKDNPKEIEDNWWHTAQKFMSEKNFLQGLLDFDKDHIPDSVMRKIREQFIPDPDFKPSRVEKASFAAKGLCQWVRALDQYDRVVKIVAPKRARAQEAEAKYRETLDGLAKKQAELRGIISQFQRLQAKLEDTKMHRQSLQDDILDCQRKLTRAKALLEGLGGEQQRWEEASVTLNELYHALIGDCLLAAATIAYLAPVKGELRGSLTQAWRSAVVEKGLSSSSDYSLQRLLGEPVTIRQWNIAGLPPGAFSVDNGIIATRARRWPLMIDPQGQASRWIKNMEGSTKAPGEGPAQPGRLVVVKPGDVDLARRFEHCIQLGLPILLEGVAEELDPLLEPLLEHATVKTGAGLSLTFGDSVLEYSPDFQLFITTKLANPHYLPEVSTKVALINFVITFESLKDQLLDLVVQKENASLDEERQRLIQTTYANKRAQRDVEQRILEVLRSSQGNILDDEKAIDALGQSQRLAQEIAHKQAGASETQNQLDQARKAYSPVAHHCSLLFFLVSKLVQADVMYQYSLTWFLQLFHLALDTFRGQVDDDQEPSGEEEVEAVGIDHLAEYFTHELYSNVCRSLFERDKLLFSFMLAAKLAQARGDLAPGEYASLVETEDGLGKNAPGLRQEWSCWLPAARWRTLCQMATRSAPIAAVVDSFHKHVDQWRIITDSKRPMSEEFPTMRLGDEERPLGNFTKLCLVKALVPGRFVPAVREYVVRERGERYLKPPLFDIERSYDDSTSATPLIFVLPGADPLQALTAFAKRKKKFESLRSISLGQGQGVRAEQAVADARKQGGWVLLQNCHLHPSWMPRLEQICDQFASKEATAAGEGSGTSTHPSFRLWLSSYRSDSFPALVLRNGVKMTNEPPSGLAANMSRSCISTRVLQEQLSEEAAEPAAAQRLFFGLCMFHAVVEGRRDYGALGWNVRYDFSISDLQITARQLCRYVGSSGAMEEAIFAVSRLAGDCNYGGRLSDERDRRVLLALLQDYCSPAILHPDYQAQGLPGFEPPSNALIPHDHLVHIKSMPSDEPPELFGLHANANISKSLREMLSMCSQLRRMGEVEGVQASPEAAEGTGAMASTSMESSGAQNDEARVAATCQELLLRLPSRPVDLALVRARYPMSREFSMNSVLVQELERYNALVKLITTSLASLLMTLSGEQLASTATEQLFGPVLLGDVPERWLKVSYPSQRSLTGYVADLRRRLAAFENWVSDGPPTVFWLPGFYSPQSFLTAVLQDHARRDQVEIDRLAFVFEFEDRSPLDDGEGSSSAWRSLHPRAPHDGVFVTGLFLEGAAWRSSENCLCESKTGELHSVMPVIKLKPATTSERATREQDEPATYECPLYRTAARRGALSTTGHSTNFVSYVALPCGRTSPAHWTKRGVALLNELST